MEKKEYNCTECGTRNFITLLGSKEVVFKTKCSSCSAELEMTVDKDEKIYVKPIDNNKNKIDKKEIFRIDENEMDIEEEISKIKKEDKKRVPDDYPIYEEEFNDEDAELIKQIGRESESKIVEFPKSTNTVTIVIAVMILISGILTLANAWAIVQMENKEGDETPISVIVIDSDGFVDNVTIMLDGERVNTSMDNRNEYPINVTTGKHTLEVRDIEGYSNVTWDIFVAETDGETLLGTEGLTKFTFELEEGSGTIEHEPNQIQEMYFSSFKYGPIILIVFGVISIWGAQMAYRQKSYAGAQIGALFGILGLGLLFVGPVLGIVSLIMLNRNRKLFSASFNEDNNQRL